VVRVVNSDYRAPKPAKGKAKRHDPWAGAKGKAAPTRYATPAPKQASQPATVSRASQGRLYLAYGSNLHRGQMRQRCPNAVPMGGMLLHDARLIFRGVADVEYAPGHQVPVGLWRISAQDEAALDRYEGVGGGFYIKETVELSDGREALIYLMTSTGVAPPSEYYVDVLRKGYRQFELDTAYLDQAVRHSWVKKEHDDQTLARRGRQRQSALHNRLAKMPERVAINLMKARASQIET
jgi:hypothetical protein